MFKDTRVLTDSERAVFAGVVQTRYGANYRFHKQMKALQEIAKRIGFYDPPGDPETNPVARLIEELQSRGQVQRMQLWRDWEQSELVPQQGCQSDAIGRGCVKTPISRI